MEDVVLILGYIASALVFASFFVKSRMRLRQVAIVSNFAFIIYGIVGQVIPVLTLHVLLLPLNIWRLWEIGQTRKAIAAAIKGDLQVDWLTPYGTEIALSGGERLFARGDTGDSMYFILAGTLQLVESGILLGTGSLVGEIAFFSPEGLRTQSAVASSDVRLLAISQEDLLILYRRHPEFGVYLLRLVTKRLLENNLRLQEADA